jgi:hypothetical protein
VTGERRVVRATSRFFADLDRQLRCGVISAISAAVMMRRSVATPQRSAIELHGAGVKVGVNIAVNVAVNIAVNVAVNVASTTPPRRRRS